MKDGFLVLDKPRGWTSRQAVDRVIALTGTRRVGHTGTLDPIATGVLVLCVGKATRLTRFTQEWDKEYRALFRLGVSSPTHDADGPISEISNPPVPTAAELNRCLNEFVGVIDQTPPAYSAVKIAGRRAYELARQGMVPHLRARRVVIHKLSVIRYEFPWLEIAVHCGPGTYIRAIARDLGAKLGCGAVMCSLVRLRVGPFDLQAALRPNELTSEIIALHLRSMREGLIQYSAITLDEAELAPLLRGLKIRCPASFGPVPAGTRLLILDRHGDLASVTEKTPGGYLRPLVNLRSPNAS